MGKQVISTGSSANDGTGDTLRSAGTKINANFTELYNRQERITVTRTTGVNVGDYGKGSDETFQDLLIELDSLEDIERIRISSIEPNLLNRDII